MTSWRDSEARSIERSLEEFYDTLLQLEEQLETERNMRAQWAIKDRIKAEMGLIEDYEAKLAAIRR